jgi:hypothetical protein
VNAEGWYQDPYGLHTDRWFSDGRPTALVRDDGTESHDPPPPAPYPEPLIESAVAENHDGSDLKRADDPSAGRTYDVREARAAAVDSGLATGGFMTDRRR